MRILENLITQKLHTVPPSTHSKSLGQKYNETFLMLEKWSNLQSLILLDALQFWIHQIISEGGKIPISILTNLV